MIDLKKLAKDLNVDSKNLLIRADGRVEWICKHGIGHTIWYPKGSNAIHTCDNCCFILNKKQIKGFEKYYISKNGKLYNSEINKFMKTYNHNGYQMVQLNYKGKRKHKSIHRLVAEAYIPNPKHKRCINHKDFNRLNNNIENLEWVTDSENQQYSYNHNRRPNQNIIAKRNGQHMCKLNKKDIINIFNLRNKGLKIKDISIKYNVHKETISRILRKITYKDYSKDYCSKLKNDKELKWLI